MSALKTQEAFGKGRRRVEGEGGGGIKDTAGIEYVSARTNCGWKEKDQVGFLEAASSAG